VRSEKKIISMKYSDITANRTRDLSACNAASQITAQCRCKTIIVFRKDIYHEQRLLSNKIYVRLFRIFFSAFSKKMNLACLPFGK